MEKNAAGYGILNAADYGKISAEMEKYLPVTLEQLLVRISNVRKCYKDIMDYQCLGGRSEVRHRAGIKPAVLGFISSKIILPFFGLERINICESVLSANLGKLRQ